MAFVLIMPRQGNTVESCIINEWQVKEGDAVDADTLVCTVETDKAVFEVPAGEKGTVLKIVREAGDDVPVLEAIAVIGAAGEDWQTALGAAVPAATAVPAAAVGATAAAPASAAAVPEAAGGVAGSGGTAVSPRARNLAAGEGVSLEGVAGTGPGGRVIERDVAAALQARPGLSAAAKAAARAGGAVPATGSGLGGRVTAADMAGGSTAATTAAVPASAAAPIPAASAVGEGAITDTPIKGVRKIIADRMLNSLASMAQFTLNASAPVSRMQELRERIKAAPPESFIDAAGLSRVTVNDLILYAVSRVLPRFPFMNAHKIGETLRTFERVHLGMAVDTPKGLMVPVIRNANLLSLAQISAEAKRLAASCQAGKIGPDEINGSTFTVTNLGSLGISSFTPVINAPEVAILGVAGIELKPVKTKHGDDDCEGFSFEPHIGFSLTINHQVVDGAPAARFLKALGDAVAEIDLLLAV
jgi:pyruvate dehydrogenase E2 component (dihydrolipoamide acetyltransferase)